MATSLPDPDSYNRVLRRYDRDPRHAHQQRFASYDVNLRAVAAELDGVVAMTLFFPRGRETAADRALRQGWLDATADWNRALGRKPDPAQQDRLDALTHAVEAMDWNGLRKYASERGLDTSGKRPDVEARVLEYHRAQVVGE
jgi:hypothetical protein